MNMLFNDAPGANSMRNFYIEQSSNRYTVHGDVTDWVPVPNNAAYYDDNPDSNVWFFLEDSVNGWYDAQIAAGQTPAQINAYLASLMSGIATTITATAFDSRMATSIPSVIHSGLARRASRQIWSLAGAHYGCGLAARLQHAWRHPGGQAITG
jgi:hypothetical protein